MEPSRLSRSPALNVSQGFTLIELMVVLSIIVIITSVVLTSQNSFNKTLILTNTAYDIALAMRSSQTFGLGSRATNVAGVSIVNAGYGLHLANGGPGNSFILFADTTGGSSCAGLTPACKPGDYVYTANADKLMQLYKLNNGIFISNFCARSWSGSWSCAAGGQLTSLDVVFIRPNPDAFISTNGSYSLPPFANTAACLTIASPTGEAHRYVSITSSGQIIANASSCPS